MTKNEKKIYHILCDNVKRCRTYVISSTNTTTHITRATLCRATTTYDHTVPCFCCTCVDVVERTVRIAHQYTIYARVRRQPIVVCFVKSSPKKSTPNQTKRFYLNMCTANGAIHLKWNRRTRCEWTYEKCKQTKKVDIWKSISGSENDILSSKHLPNLQ